MIFTRRIFKLLELIPEGIFVWKFHQCEDLEYRESLTCLPKRNRLNSPFYNDPSLYAIFLIEHMTETNPWLHDATQNARIIFNCFIDEIKH